MPLLGYPVHSTITTASDERGNAAQTLFRGPFHAFSFRRQFPPIGSLLRDSSESGKKVLTGL